MPNTKNNTLSIDQLKRQILINSESITVGAYNLIQTWSEETSKEIHALIRDYQIISQKSKGKEAFKKWIEDKFEQVIKKQ